MELFMGEAAESRLTQLHEGTPGLAWCRDRVARRKSGGATGLYWDGETVKRLSPWEAMRTHSIPEHAITCLRQMQHAIGPGTMHRLCGNGIPVGMVSDVATQILSIIKPQVRSRISTAIAAWQSHDETPSL